MNNLVIVFSGKIGSGKSTLANGVAEYYGIPFASFGSAVKRIADSEGFDSEDRTVLQSIGSRLVDEEPERLCKEALGNIGGSFVIDGLRHISILEILKNQFSENLLFVYVGIDESVRIERLVNNRQVSPALIAEWDCSDTEGHHDELRERADWVADNNGEIECARESLFSEIARFEEGQKK